MNASTGTLNATTAANQIQQILNQIEEIKTAVDTFLKLLAGFDAYAVALGQWQGPGGAKDLLMSPAAFNRLWEASSLHNSA
ncbi:MAG TPA: hypothetical protein VFS12_12740 [Terriglobia bacterium]|nr:hypothetical protein [Terriglobia bacterium]